MRRRLRRARVYCGALALLGALSTGSCRKQQPAPATAPPAEVGIVVLQPESVLITAELPGRTAAYETSEVRPQVSGDAVVGSSASAQEVLAAHAMVAPQPLFVALQT